MFCIEMKKRFIPIGWAIFAQRQCSALEEKLSLRKLIKKYIKLDENTTLHFKEWANEGFSGKYSFDPKSKIDYTILAMELI